MLIIVSARSETRSTTDRRITDAGGMAFYDPQQLPYDHSSMMSKLNGFITSLFKYSFFKIQHMLLALNIQLAQ